MPIYENYTAPNGTEWINAMYSNGLMVTFPCDENNPDYRKYLEWQASQENN